MSIYAINSYFVTAYTGILRISASTPGTIPVETRASSESGALKGPETPAEPLPDLELALPPSPPPIEDVLAARRAKRAAILAKYQSQQSETPSQVNSGEVVNSAQPSDEGYITRSQSTGPASGVNSIPSGAQPKDDLSDGE